MNYGMNFSSLKHWIEEPCTLTEEVFGHLKDSFPPVKLNQKCDVSIIDSVLGDPTTHSLC